MHVRWITDRYAVSPQISVAEVANLASAGFACIICNRPDGEEADQPSATNIAAACSAVGLGFHHIPVRGMPIPADDVAQHRRIINESTGPVLAYCRSGQRSVAIFQAGT
jgi:sulfide:quinone oxidoreductase